jgi:uncharacterized protein YdhG (YjbR/CyaY superfamily)
MSASKTSRPRSVDAYLASLRPDYRAALQKLRRTIKAAAPEATEVISYRMPAFRYFGMLVYYAAFEDHCSLFVASAAVRRKFARELKPYASGKGTLRFTPERPLPAVLVRRIVKARVAEIERKRKQ